MEKTGNAGGGLSTLTGPVEIIGVGLLGTSVALACSSAGIEVLLSDAVASHVRTATGLGAGRRRKDGDQPQLIVVAVPPAHLGEVIVKALRENPDAVVTDVGSVKASPLAYVREHSPRDVSRYVGGHPMAGSERSGPLAATSALFEGRPWAVTPHADADPRATQLVDELAALCGGVPLSLSPEDHDQAVARTSHVPHLMAALVAGRLAVAPEGHLGLSGQGVRDVTRVAAGDPGLYGQIVAGNARAVTDLLTEVRAQLDEMIAAVGNGDAAALDVLLKEGQAGTRAIPGKHGGPQTAQAIVYVTVPDEPGNLARLFADAGESGVNIEDVRIDHDPGRPVGVMELVVAETAADQMQAVLESRGWVAHR
ncbi:prephenate dehydrogenase [Nocardioides luteus]|uniref:Prephenate dehydrogenase n=1 Tax=Nocardioides luteus TaxID=1844 RepID=A0ABQ5T101_9ACTN|nr:prephenate dehydrogenase [Nocardioides luteus]MDR7310466.1 prephenate dehydrogenase [Nocardioides luteus]GGR73571.1 prephenate dehydrogenase [Nocardioides luteus]GLJ69754.1 prephenate dehydrogenase [Nocardioides luteus]